MQEGSPYILSLGEPSFPNYIIIQFIRHGAGRTYPASILLQAETCNPGLPTKYFIPLAT